MTYKLKIIKTIEPKKSALQRMSGSPVGWWKVTTEGDCEGRTTTQLGEHYGHVAEIALSLEKSGYSFRFVKVEGGYDGDEKPRPKLHPKRQIVRKSANISFDCFTHKNGEKELSEWLDCDEIKVLPCNYYGAYTIQLKD